MNIKDIKVGDKFSTESKLLAKVGLKKYSGKTQKEYQIKELQRYIEYEKTGKTSRGKVTNEIIITKIFDTPKEKVDNRNGGNRTSIIADYMHNYIVNKIEDDYCIEGTKSSIIKQMGFYCCEFNDYFYNFDNTIQRKINNELVPYEEIEKKFYFDYIAKISCSYMSRFKRVLNSFGDALTIVKFYRTCKTAISKNGNEYMKTTDYSDKETIDKIKATEKNTQFLFNVTEPSQLWKIYGDTETYNKYHDEFIKQVKTLLNDQEIINCYEVLNIIRNGESDKDFETKVDEETCEFDWKKLNIAQSKLAYDKIDNTFNIKKSVFDSYNNEWIKVLKYNRDDISSDMIKDCIDMINVNIGATLNPITGEISYGDFTDDTEENII